MIYIRKILRGLKITYCIHYTPSKKRTKATGERKGDKEKRRTEREQRQEEPIYFGERGILGIFIFMEGPTVILTKRDSCKFSN